MSCPEPPTLGIALQRLERAHRRWLSLHGQRAAYEQQGRPPPLRIETRLWRVTAFILLLSGQLGEHGYSIALPLELLAFVAAGIHSALRGDPPRPFVELRYLATGTNPSPRDVIAREHATAFVHLAESGSLNLTKDEAIEEVARAYGKEPVTIRRWLKRRAAPAAFSAECRHEMASGHARDLTEAARNLIRQAGARYRARAAEAEVEKEKRRKKLKRIV
jgi:hypothetical protein